MGDSMMSGRKINNIMHIAAMASPIGLRPILIWHFNCHHLSFLEPEVTIFGRDNTVFVNVEICYRNKNCFLYQAVFISAVGI